jgi:hypothetical protein
MNSEELNSDIKNYSGGPLILTQPSSTRIEDNLSGPKNTTVDNILVRSFYETNTPIDNEDLIQGLKNTVDNHIDIPEISFLHNDNELSIPIDNEEPSTEGVNSNIQYTNPTKSIANSMDHHSSVFALKFITKLTPMPNSKSHSSMNINKLLDIPSATPYQSGDISNAESQPNLQSTGLTSNAIHYSTSFEPFEPEEFLVEEEYEYPEPQVIEPNESGLFRYRVKQLIPLTEYGNLVVDIPVPLKVLEASTREGHAFTHLRCNIGLI